MKQVWIAEHGEYEERYTAFAGVSIEALLAYVRKLHPEGDYTYEKEVRHRRVDHFLRGKVHINASGGNFDLSQHDYDLSEVDFAV